LTEKCSDVAWKAGFHGPWAIEHWNEDNKAFARETAFLRDQLKEWMAAATALNPLQPGPRGDGDGMG
jgi:hypothetical protein